MLRLTGIALALAAASTASAQSLADRVSRAPDGVVRMLVESRSGVCGDGDDVVGYRSAIFARNFQSFGGHWSERSCIPGPLLVSVFTVDGEVTRLRTQVGGDWARTEQRVTDLGAVAAAEASTFFFSLVPRLERSGNKDRLLIPAVLADVPPPIQPLLGLVRNTDRLLETRRAAVQWLGIIGDASVVPTLVELARADGSDDDTGKRGKKGLGDGALAALSMLEEAAGVPALIDLARTGSSSTRHNAVFWLGQNGDVRARRMLHSVIENADESVNVRAHAIFSLSHGRETPESEFAWLRGVYARLREEKLKESVMQAMAQDEDPDAGRWMIARVLDENESRAVRKSALFWGGQRDETPTADLARAYREVGDAGLKEHAIFVLSQRKDDDATDALMKIATADPDRRMRSKALFWLAQNDDPRVRKLIANIVLGEKP